MPAAPSSLEPPLEPPLEPSPAESYASTRQGLIDRCATLPTQAAERRVPLTPAWRVKDVVAHVCGINADFIDGRLEGLGSDEWTRRQVDERRDSSLADICAEWGRHAPAIDALFAANPDLAPRLLGDLIVHVHDIDHALGVEPDRASPATVIGARRYAPQLQDRALALLGAGLSLDLGSAGTFASPPGATTLHLRCTPYDFLRSVTGRRSRTQVAGLEWGGEPVLVDRLIDSAISSYGPLQTDDVSI